MRIFHIFYKRLADSTITLTCDKVTYEPGYFSIGYPKYWGLKTTDKNIDHRRVPNLMKFFERHGETIPISENPSDYIPGDIVCWNLRDGITHIGIVIDRKAGDNKHNLIVHNIGAGQVIQDCLFDFRIIGHYRYTK